MRVRRPGDRRPTTRWWSTLSPTPPMSPSAPGISRPRCARSPPSRDRAVPPRARQLRARARRGAAVHRRRARRLPVGAGPGHQPHPPARGRRDACSPCRGCRSMTALGRGRRRCRARLFVARVAAGGVRTELTDDDLDDGADDLRAARRDGAGHRARRGARRQLRRRRRAPGDDRGPRVPRPSDTPRTSATARCGRRSTGATTCSTTTQRALLRAVSVFAVALRPRGRVRGHRTPTTTLFEVLGRLVDWNLVDASPRPPDPLPDARDHPTVRRRARRRARRARCGPRPAPGLVPGDARPGCSTGRPVTTPGAPRSTALIDDARAALVLGGGRRHRRRRRRRAPSPRSIADVSFQRGRPAEAQRRYEQAAELVRRQRPAGRRGCCLAAGSALTRYAGDEAVAPAPARRSPRPDAPETTTVPPSAIARIVTTQHRHDGHDDRPHHERARPTRSSPKPGRSAAALQPSRRRSASPPPVVATFLDRWSPRTQAVDAAATSGDALLARCRLGPALRDPARGRRPGRRRRDRRHPV